MKKHILICAATLSVLQLKAQVSPLDGIKDDPGKTYAFIHATIHTDPKTTIEDGILWIENGKIKEAGSSVKLPENIQQIDCKGLHIYPSFIELNSTYGMPEVKRTTWRSPQYESSKPGAYYWNEAVKPEVHASGLFEAGRDEAKNIRNYGIGTVLVHQNDGIVQGTGMVVTTADEKEEKTILLPRATQHFSFSKGISGQDYPSSLTGSIALLRQFFYDAGWYEKMKGKADVNLSLDAYLRQKDLTAVFNVRDKLEIFRAWKIAQEFGLHFIYNGNGDEYQQVAAIKDKKIKLIIPISFPEAYDVSDPMDADMLGLAEMKHWELAPTNPATLASNEIIFSITHSGIEKPEDYFKNMHKACNYGLSEEKLLEALTTVPASYLGISDKAGTLENGKMANFLITENELGKSDFVLLENWVQGSRYVINRKKEYTDVRGTYQIIAPDFDFIHNKKIVIEGKPERLSGKFHYSDTTKLNLEVYAGVEMISAAFYSKGQQGYIRISAVVDPGRKLKGTVETTEGKTVPFEAILTEYYKETEAEKTEDQEYKTGEVWYPNRPYGWMDEELKNVPAKYLIKNPTVWTNEKEGILTGYDVMVENGKIKKIGRGLSENGCEIIDGTGKHLTCGIIDEHSHIALTRGVNEGTQSSSAEVRMGDVVNGEDINIYRQLAGGVTMAQLLHGSANPIGGQSAIIKLRWGKLPEEMLMQDTPGFIKFALGENVKQSNWGPNYSIRYPQTRMGVEQFYFEMFKQALEYEKRKKESKDPVRKDLELETLLEILHGKRFITCHSYVQSEINMLMHVADSMGFKVNTFTHILEGYKVADKMKKHGANASTFADWWAYKMEVVEAIPYNGAILTKVGVNTAINSDDAEMARRLNQEAAKLVKYGGLTQEEAWKTVTLNPAKMLHLDQRVGSIREGKDADLVLWSDNPLSIYARALTTWVDGIVLYDEKRDELLKERIQKERNRLIQKMLLVKQKGEPTVPVNKQQQILYHCDDMGEGLYQLIQLNDEK